MDVEWLHPCYIKRCCGQQCRAGDNQLLNPCLLQSIVTTNLCQILTSKLQCVRRKSICVSSIPQRMTFPGALAFSTHIYPVMVRICVTPWRTNTNLTTVVIRSQIKSLYRYGARPVCAPKMEDFKFCLSLKSMHPEERRDAWITRRAEWWANKRLIRSSEDVWEIRMSVMYLPRSLCFEGLFGSAGNL